MTTKIIKIALDWDGTYTLNPQFWNMFIMTCLNSGVDIRIVTLRPPNHTLETHLPIPVIYTDLKQKREHCDIIGWQPDIWIDDTPEFIVREDVWKFVTTFKEGVKDKPFVPGTSPGVKKEDDQDADVETTVGAHQTG